MPLKIVCLHGYCQNAQIFRRKSGAMRKSLERSVSAVRRSVCSESASQCPTSSMLQEDSIPLAEFEYLDAPFVLEDRLIPPDNAKGTESDKYISVYRPVKVASSNRSTQRVGPSSEFNSGAKSQTHSNADSDLRPLDRTRRSWWQAESNGLLYEGWEETLRDLRTAFRENGAVVASLLCALRESSDFSKTAPELHSLRFALLFSGAPSRATIHKPLYKQPLCTPSLHIWGTQDEVVPPHLSERLMKCYLGNKRHVHTHDGGHFVPSDRVSRLVVSKFVLDAFDRIRQAKSQDIKKKYDSDNIQGSNNSDDENEGENNWLRAAL